VDPGFFEKGNMSNVFTFAVMAAGIALRFSRDSSWEDNVVGRWVGGPKRLVDVLGLQCIG
jgi:hypothetical protein